MPQLRITFITPTSLSLELPLAQCRVARRVFLAIYALTMDSTVLLTLSKCRDAVIFHIIYTVSLVFFFSLFASKHRPLYLTTARRDSNTLEHKTMEGNKSFFSLV